MARFEIEVEGDQLGRAQLALNGAGFPTIASGTGDDEGWGERRRRGGFFRSAAFPILVVIVLAFFAQRVISPAEDADPIAYSDFLAQVEEAPEMIDKVTLDPEDYSLEVSLVSGGEYETGYPPETEESLINTLRRQQVETVVEDARGGSLLSWILYVLPFLLFFAFWVFLMRRMERRQDEGRGTSSAAGLQLNRLSAVVEAESSEGAVDSVQSALPPDGEYRLGKPKQV